MFPKKHLRALFFMVDFFKENNIPYVLTGGSAAKMYGSPREVIDLDFDVPNECLESIAESLREHATSGPRRHRGEGFNVMLLELEYGGVAIDIGGAEDFEIFDKKNKKWVPDVTDLARFEEISIQGKIICVVPVADLLAYKGKLLREVDIKDIEALDSI